MFDTKTFIKNLTHLPGVYRLLDKQGKVLYVGKAKNLKKRVSSYFRKNLDNIKLKSLMQHVTSIDVIVTPTENEALILENDLIKEHHPRYNISFRDDKTYPHIFLSQETFPRLTVHRGNKKETGSYFGPYTNAHQMRESLQIIQKLFHIRSCRNSFFRLRNRPCLQYQINRCSAPCVNMISEEAYCESIHLAKMFLSGHHHVVISKLTEYMNHAAQNLQYELAAKYRDQIQLLREFQTKQHTSSDNEDLDILAIVKEQNLICIQLLIIRHSKIIADKTFFPKTQDEKSLPEILSAFIGQYYLNTDQFIPNKIILNCLPEDLNLLQDTISAKVNHKITFKTRTQKTHTEWLKTTILNAEQTLKHRLLTQSHFHQKLIDLQKILGLKTVPQRIECFDISHTAGEATIASCVVFNEKGFMKEKYRRFNIENITPGDDPAAIKQALTRHYTRLKNQSQTLPDILIIDGGKGQLKQAISILETLQLTQIILLGIAKAIDRKPGYETIYISNRKLEIKAGSPAFLLLQQIRDEAHRFAITGHRKKRASKRNHSILEEIHGIGKKRRQILLKHFGGLQQLKRATIEDLTNVNNIDLALAKRIYKHLHS